MPVSRKEAQMKSMIQRKLKILIISAHPPIDSELMKVWLKQGHQVYKISLSSAWHNQFSDLGEGVKEMIPKSKPDLILCGELTDTIIALTLKVIKRWTGTKVVYIHWWFPPRNPLLYLVTNISVCDYERRYLRHLLGIRSKVAYCPVDINHFKSLQLKKEKKFIAIGNDFKNREMMGYDHLLNIIKKVHEKDPGIKIGVFGMNEPKDYPDYVEVRSLDKEELLTEINTSECVIFTTTRNLIMNSLQISMSCEANVIAFDLEPFREVIQNAVSGHLIKLGDDLAFADKVVTVCNSPDVKMGHLARKSIIEKCDSSIVAEQIVQIALNAKKL